MQATFRLAILGHRSVQISSRERKAPASGRQTSAQAESLALPAAHGSLEDIFRRASNPLGGQHLSPEASVPAPRSHPFEPEQSAWLASLDSAQNRPTVCRLATTPRATGSARN